MKDVLTILKLVLCKFELSTSIKIKNHHQCIENIKLQQFKNNEVEMIQAIEKHYKFSINNRYEFFKDLLLSFFNAFTFDPNELSTSP